MFILDSLMISGIRWALETAVTAAEAEMNDDSGLREQLLEAEMSREMGEISDEAFQDIEADLLARIREIKERREGGAGPLAFGGAQPMETTGDSTFQIETSISGDFHDAGTAPHTTVLESLDHHHAIANLVETGGRQEIELLDMEPGDAAPPGPAPSQLAMHGGSAPRNPPHTKKAKNPPHSGRVSNQPHEGKAAVRSRSRSRQVAQPMAARSAREGRAVRTSPVAPSRGGGRVPRPFDVARGAPSTVERRSGPGKSAQGPAPVRSSRPKRP